jgi:hypothetical protein
MFDEGRPFDGPDKTNKPTKPFWAQKVGRWQFPDSEGVLKSLHSLRPFNGFRLMFGAVSVCQRDGRVAHLEEKLLG